MRVRLGELRALVSEAVSAAYDILGVPPSASPEELKKAYRMKAIALHPDRNTGRDTTEDMKRLNVAYGLLSDPMKRIKYDMNGDTTLGDQGGSSSWQSSPAHADRDSQYDASDAARKRRNTQRNADDAQRARERQQRQQPPAGSGKSDVDYSVYLTNTIGRANKFWSAAIKALAVDKVVVRVRWGRIGAVGASKVISFPSYHVARKLVDATVRLKRSGGYVLANDPQRSPPPPPPPSPKTPPPAAKSQAAPAPSVANKQYKIYGTKNAPPVTRYKGVLYKGAANSKFRPGDSANVGLGTDGRLSVNDPKTGHTQTWTSETVSRLVDDLILDGMFGYQDE